MNYEIFKHQRILAEKVGFEPTEPVRAQRFSRPPDSTTLAPLRELLILNASPRNSKLSALKRRARFDVPRLRSVRAPGSEEFLHHRAALIIPNTAHNFYPMI
jgi:hypothetical protein